MKLTQRLTAAERREQILEAALDLFAQKGFSGARTKEIAKNAGISETLIFQHFKTKAELYQAAMEHLYREHPLDNEMHDPMEQEDDEALLKAVALHMLSHTRQDPRIVRLHLYRALGDTGDQSGDQPEHMEEDDTVVKLAAYIRRRIDHGIFAPGNPWLLARQFIYGVFMATADRQLGLLGAPLEMADEDLAQALSQIFLNGLRTR